MTGIMMMFETLTILQVQVGPGQGLLHNRPSALIDAAAHRQ